MSLMQKFKSFGPVDRRSLFVGLGFVCLFYLLFYIYISAFSASALTQIESTLAHQVVPLIKNEVEQKSLTQEKEKIATSAGAVHSENKSEHSPANDLDKIDDPQKHSKKANLPAVIDGTYEETTAGLLPVVRESDYLTAFNAYKRPFEFKAINKPMLAIIVSDFGLSKLASETAIDLLPPEVSYSLSPYADMASEWAKILRQSGKEFWLNVPIENSDISSDIGVMGIRSGSTFLINQKGLYNILSSVQSYAGVSSFSASSGVEDDRQVRKIMEEVFERGLGYVELNPNANSNLMNVSLIRSAPYIKADMTLAFTYDSNPFLQLENIIQAKGYAVLVVPAYPQNIKRLAEWILKVAQVEYQLVPVSAVYDLPRQMQKLKSGAVNKITEAVQTSHAETLQHAPTGELKQTDKVEAPEHGHE